MTQPETQCCPVQRGPVSTYWQMDATQRLRDANVALRCQLGEAEEFRELVAEMERPLWYFAGKLLGNDDAALDVLQQTWLRAFRTIRRWPSERPLSIAAAIAGRRRQSQAPPTYRRYERS